MVASVAVCGLGRFLSWWALRRAKCFDGYLTVDIHSRFIVGAHVHTTESGVLAVEMMKEIFGIHGIPQVVHADRGTSMTSKSVAALLSDLEVTRSHSRPRVSNDNPYSEALFKTLKYGPEFPERFAASPRRRCLYQRFRGLVQPSPPTPGHRLPHPRYALRPRRRHHQRTLGNPRCSPDETPRTLHDNQRSKNPCAPRTSVDQSTPGPHRRISRPTPVGTVQLEKLRPGQAFGAQLQHELRSDLPYH